MYNLLSKVAYADLFKRKFAHSTMKKTVYVALVVAALAALAFATAFATTGFGQDVVKIKSDPPQRVDAAFRLFETQNMWNFLLLDTRYGLVWQVQYSTRGTDFKRPINVQSLIAPGVKPRVGRFTLYPTTNMWNFLLLDQDLGEVWQCQFSISKEIPPFIKHIQ